MASEDLYFFTARIDFAIVKKGFNGTKYVVLAIELDGPEHKNDPKVIERDKKKEQICKEHGCTLIHVDNTYARRYNYIKDILTDFFSTK